MNEKPILYFIINNITQTFLNNEQNRKGSHKNCTNS